jgi:hypothetical protein
LWVHLFFAGCAAFSASAGGRIGVVNRRLLSARLKPFTVLILGSWCFDGHLINEDSHEKLQRLE